MAAGRTSAEIGAGIARQKAAPQFAEIVRTLKGALEHEAARYRHRRPEIERLYLAAREVLAEWTQRLDAEAGAGFPDKVTAFHEQMAVHGRHGKPCPVCGAPVQRIVYAENETNYCARCQTGGRILADRALSRLLKKTFPRSIDELE